MVGGEEKGHKQQVKEGVWYFLLEDKSIAQILTVRTGRMNALALDHHV